MGQEWWPISVNPALSNPSTWEAEAGESLQSLAKTLLHSDFRATLGYSETLSQNHKYDGMGLGKSKPKGVNI